jgi:hypothetical protein
MQEPIFIVFFVRCYLFFFISNFSNVVNPNHLLTMGGKNATYQ